MVELIIIANEVMITKESLMYIPWGIENGKETSFNGNMLIMDCGDRRLQCV